MRRTRMVLAAALAAAACGKDSSTSPEEAFAGRYDLVAWNGVYFFPAFSQDAGGGDSVFVHAGHIILDGRRGWLETATSHGRTGAIVKDSLRVLSYDVTASAGAPDSALFQVGLSESPAGARTYRAAVHGDTIFLAPGTYVKQH